jgi:hypothetical protein
VESANNNKFENLRAIKEMLIKGARRDIADING